MLEHVSMTIGMAITPSFLQYLYDKSPRGPFIGVSMIDVASSILVIVFCCFGFGNMPKVVD